MKTPTVLILSLLTSAQVLASDWLSVLEYRNVGPMRGGRVTAVTGTVAESGTFYLGASGGGVWKSTDYGQRWENVSDGFFASPSIGDIAVSQSDPNIVYVGTGSDGLRSNVIRGLGVYRSVDGARTWEHVGLRDSGHIGAVEIDPSDNSTVWVAAIGQAFSPNEERGVYRSKDGGNSWERRLFVSDEVGFSDLELLPGDPSVVFATAWRAERKPWTIVSGGEQDQGGLYKSQDGGESWRRISEGLPTGLIGKIDLAIPASDSSVVYALVEAPGDAGGLYRSDNQGESFVQVSSEKALRTRPFYYTNVEVDPSDPDTVYVMATRFHRSTDGGKSWEKLETPHADNHDMWINPNNPQLFIQGNDGGANVTHNAGATWSTQFNQPTSELYQVEVDDQYPYWLYGGMQDNWSTVAVPSRAPRQVQHAGALLIETGGCETGPAVPKPGNHNTVYANCKGRFGVYDKRTGAERRYYVGAANMYGQNPADLQYRFQRVSPVHVSPHDSGVVYHASQFVHRTRDEGKNWDTISPDLTAFEADKQVLSGAPITRDITGEEFYSTLYSLRESPLAAGTIWVGANDGPVHVTRDSGESWNDVTPRGLPAGGRVDSVEPSNHDAAAAYIAVHRYLLGDWSPYIYRTSDYGRRWRKISGKESGIPEDHPVRVVREDPIRPGLLYAGTEYGVYISLNNGEQWHAFQQNLPVTPITDLRIHRGDIVLSTMGRGFWILDKGAAMLRQLDAIEAPREATLFAPAPSIRYRTAQRASNVTEVPDLPAAAAIIEYFLPAAASSPITLEVFDADGASVNAFQSKAADDTASDTASDKQTPVRERDMALNEDRFIDQESLLSTEGLHRFRWDMRYRGPWHSDEKKRFKSGPVVPPGDYLIRLTSDGKTLEQALSVVLDPRSLTVGVDETVVQAQAALQREVMDLLNRARALARHLKEAYQADEAASDDDARAIYAQLVTAPGTYMPPRLIDQVSYLYNMLGHADQAPGADALARLDDLIQAFETLDRKAATL